MRLRHFITRDRSLRWLAAVGYGLGLTSLVILVSYDGGRAYDASAYWLAGRHVLDGTALYVTDVTVNAWGAWKYPPVFAQVLAPFALMPELVFDWAWRIVCFLCLRGIMGSWRNVGLALLLPPVWNGLSVANVTFPVAFLAMQALRGRPTFLPVAIALKFGPVLLMPFILLRRGAAERRRLLLGIVSFAALCAISALAAPDAWRDYIATVGPQAIGGTDGFGVIAFASTGMMDVAIRGTIAVAAVVVAIAIDDERLAWAAAVITVPVLFVARFAPLVAVLFWPRAASTGSTPRIPAPRLVLAQTHLARDSVMR